MAGQYTLILAADYNTIRTTINSVFGPTTDGYGQTLDSAAVTANTSIIYAADWDNLRNDIIRCRQHQTGNTETLTDVTSTTVVSEAIRAAYATMANDCVTNRYAIGAGQFSLESGISSSRAGNWKVSLSHTVTVSFANNNQFRYFFTSAGEIRFSASRSGAASTTKDTTWDNMFSGMGTISMNYTATSCSGSGTTSSIGAFDLTTSDQQIFQKDAPSGAYSENYYRVSARVDNATPTAIIFTIIFVDADTGGPASTPAPGSSPGEPPGAVVDENVTGTITSTVAQLRASGANVSVTGPTYANTSVLAGS